MATTTNYGWTTPDDTALVKDGASAIRTLGSSIDTTLKAQIDAQIPDTLLTTTGDVIYASAANTPARLGIGTTGQVLQVSGGIPAWTTLAASGGITLISTTTLTGASVTLSSIPQTYKHLQIVVRNFRPATDNSGMQMQFNGNTTTYSSTGANNASSSIAGSSISDVATNTDNGTASGFGFGMIPDYTNTATWKIYEGSSFTNNATTPANYNYQRIAGVFGQTSAISSITFAPSSGGNFTSGTILLYGVS